MNKIFNPCDECGYSFSKQNQASGMCGICEFKKALQDVKTLSGMYEKLSDKEVSEYNRLEKYKSLEEQRKLLCTKGDTVYHLCTFENRESEIIEMKVGCVEPFGAIRNHKGKYEVWNVYAETDYTKAYFRFFDFNKTVFLTKEAAEAALKEMSE